MIEGVTVKMGEQEYIIPPLNFRQLRRFRPLLDKFKDIQAGMSEEQMGAMAEIIHAAMTRNYPELTVEQVEEMIDLGNMQRVFHAVMSVSGLVKSQGEAEPGTGMAKS